MFRREQTPLGKDAFAVRSSLSLSEQETACDSPPPASFAIAAAMALDRRTPQGDPAEAVARVSAARRDVLLRVHRHRLGREDLEDCFSQATLGLVTRARTRARAFVSDAHVANALEQRFLSRIADRRRAIEGRSPIEAARHQALFHDEAAPLPTRTRIRRWRRCPIPRARWWSSSRPVRTSGACRS